MAVHRRTLTPTLTLPLLACLAALALPQAAQAQAQGPTFNCAKAQGEVEKQICANPALAALDRQLDAAYKAASAKAKGAPAQTLKAMQRGWVKGRNECWKATQQTWITASWTVDTVPACIEAQYRVRISELEAVWRLKPPRTEAHACQNNPANEVVANFFDTDPPTIQLERGDRTALLWRVGPAAAGKFEGQNVSLVQQGATLAIEWLDVTSGKTEALRCQAK